MSSLQYHQNPPTGGSISLDNLRKICIDRLRVLDLVEKHCQPKSQTDIIWMENVLRELSTNFPLAHSVCTKHGYSFAEMKARHMDKVAYYTVAHLVVANTSKELRKWFIRNESKLIKIYFINLSPEGQRKFLLENGLCCEPIERDFQNPENYQEVYKVVFTQALSLVATKRCYLKNGFAYFDSSNLPAIVCQFGEYNLLSFLSKVRCNVEYVKQDPRFADIISELGEIAVKRLENRNRVCIDEDNVSLESLEDLSYSFPPCMLRIHRHLQEKGHLKYDARAQYTPFLKDIGLTVADALQFFQTSFTTLPTQEDFVKRRYAYYIRYQYGLEAQGKPCPTPTCSIMQSSNQCTQACHGCPFVSAALTTSFLNSTSSEIYNKDNFQQVLSLVEEGLPGQACSAFLSLELNDVTSIPDAVHNPLQYYTIKRKQDRRSEEELF